MKMKYVIASTPILLGVICFLAKAIIGSNVAADGKLEEPFFLIPIGYLLLFIGIVSLCGVTLVSMFKKTQISN
ncbi:MULTISPECIES: DUF3955 domain-containing protein [unclassified Lysinibacillus]|uniref:DUF3955 domain-containing protein n=1 Tax=unclassified Lysinibacillus TaxID=2636778 RepID=UPI0025521EE0|nr:MULTISPECIES: DUF3955 domain-containing protein [unclassified Lysinibacillus]MDM5248574.1 DUF3955 domain-containing protein [Lysinibacillus sp. G4S2]